jgi:hypothetical protein
MGFRGFNNGWKRWLGRVYGADRRMRMAAKNRRPAGTGDAVTHTRTGAGTAAGAGARNAARTTAAATIAATATFAAFTRAGRALATRMVRTVRWRRKGRIARVVMAFDVLKSSKFTHRLLICSLVCVFCI